MSRATLPAAVHRLLGSEWPRLEDALVLLAVASPISIALTNAAYVVCLVLFARDWNAGRRHPVGTPLDGVILVWILANVLATVTSVDWYRSLTDIRSLGHFGMVYLFLGSAGSGLPLRRVQNAWLAAGAVAAAAALITFFLELALGDETGKARGFFGGHLAFGHYMVLLTAVALVRLSDARGGMEQAATGAALFLFVAATAASEGRGPWVALVAVVLVSAVFARRRQVLAALALLVGLQLGYFALLDVSPARFYSSFLATTSETSEGIPRDRFYSNVWRLTMWRHGLQRFAESPVSGTGVETTKSVSARFTDQRDVFPVRHLHSNYLEVLMTRGFVGLFALVLFLLVSAVTLLRALDRAPPGVERAAIFGGLGAVIAHAVHGVTWFSIGKAEPRMATLIVLGMALGAAQSLDRKETLFRLDGRKLLRAAALLAAFTLLWPYLSPYPGVVAGLAGVGLADAAWETLRGRVSPTSAALVLSLAVVVVGTVLLLEPPYGPVATRVLVAAAAPFAVFHLGNRLLRRLF